MAKSFILISIIVAVLIFAAVFPLIKNSVDTGRHSYACSDSVFSTACTDTSKCTNQTYVCNDTGTPIRNVSLNLCTNASGVSVVNSTPYNGCDVVSYNIAANDYGWGTAEYVVLGLVTYFAIFGFILLGLGLTRKGAV